jgi:glycoside hydrolase-like protein
MSRRGPRILRALRLPARGALPTLALLACTAGAVVPAGASARTIHFDGQRVQAPAGWPVYRLARHPRMCVRLDRRAVYLGAPAANQRCPADAVVGGRRAILVESRAAARASRSALPAPARRVAGASSGGSVFTGLGFDACAAPSSRTMAAWAASPYRAIGVYIGGTNRGCSQPNLTSSWVSAQTAAGWHLIPTYVGLQAPTSACGSCAKLSGSRATAQGEEAAVDAVAQAASVAIGPGSPIYFDMEGYSRTSSSSAATLAFLEAWTGKLHALGYVSGVYSSGASGIADLADELGTGYTLPDNIWVANWNGQATATDPYLPGGGWTQHQRIHQYRGGHDESYGGATINIDNNYVDGGTVGTAASSTTNEDPVGSLDLVGSPVPGQVRVKGWAFDLSAPTEPLAIRAYVGGRPGAPSAVPYELGVVANQSRLDVGAKFRRAGPNHGFDLTFPIVKSGPQPVCVYALNTGGGVDHLLGCKSTTIPVAVTLSVLKTTPTGVKVWAACEWPTGTECPGQFVLRTRVKVALPHRRGTPPRIRAVTRSLGRRAFHLSGKQGHGFVIPLSAGGRALLKQRGRLPSQLIAAIPGGRRTVAVGLGR